MGGHLASWGSYEEQLEVEQYYIKQGLILPVFHRQYWLGLRAVQHPTFKWLDPFTKPPSSSTYQHWGAREPNNAALNEFCGVGNWSQAVRAACCLLPAVVAQELCVGCMHAVALSVH
jgi:hypothetical protein